MIIPTNVNQAARLSVARRPDVEPPPISIGLHIGALVSPAVVAASLTHVARSHTALRTYFPDAATISECTCVSAAHTSWEPRVIDLRSVPAAGRGASESAALAELGQSFDPADNPLRRATLLMFEDRCYLGIAVDHLVFDGMSCDVFLRDFAAACRRISQDQPPLAAGSDAAEFARLERAFLHSSAGSRSLSFWERIWRQTGPYPPAFCGERTSIAAGSEQGTDAWVRKRVIPAKAVRACQRQARGYTSPFALSAAAILATLASYNGDTKCGLVFQSARRSLPQTRGMIGFLSNRLVLSAELAGLETFTEITRHVSGQLYDVLDNELVPFEHLVDQHARSSRGRRGDFPHISLNSSVETVDLDLGMAMARVDIPEFGPPGRGNRLSIVVTPRPDGSVAFDYQNSGSISSDLADEFVGAVAGTLTSAL